MLIEDNGYVGPTKRPRTRTHNTQSRGGGAGAFAAREVAMRSRAASPSMSEQTCTHSLLYSNLTLARKRSVKESEAKEKPHKKI